MTYQPDISPVDAAYLAGLIDGEGCIAVTATNTNKSAKQCKRGLQYRGMLSVRMVDRSAIEWAHQITGLGSIRPYKAAGPNRRSGFTWTCWSKEAAIIAATVLPYLKVKRAQAENIISFQSIMRKPGTKGLTDEEWEMRERHRQTSYRLNKRGACNDLHS